LDGIAFIGSTFYNHAMKTKSILALALASVVFLVQSCALTASVSQPEVESGKKDPHTGSGSNYVVLNDGTIQSYKSLKLVTGVFTSPHLLAEGRIKIQATDICAYQNDDHYALSQQNLVNARRSKSAVETLPGFAVRIVSGRLNIYCQKYYNGSGTSEKIFIQIGNEGAIMAYKAELLNDILKEHPEAFNFFNSRKKIAPLSKKILAAAELFNNEPLLTRN
jgi:hypothetical protein